MVSRSGTLSSVEQSTVGDSYGGFDNRQQVASSTASPQLASPQHDSYGGRQIVFASVERNAVEAAYLSNGPRLYVEGVMGVAPVQGSTCFHRVCAALGVLVPASTCRVVDLRDDVLLELQSRSNYAKIYYEYSDVDHKFNHVMLAAPSVKSTRIELIAPDGSQRVQPVPAIKYVGVTNFVQFFNKSNMFSEVMFFSGEDGQGEDAFGADVSTQSNPALSFAEDSGRLVGSVGTAQREQYVSGRDPAQPNPSVPYFNGGGRSTRPTGATQREQSVSDPDSRSGQANVTSGVVRPRRRVVASKSKFNPTSNVVKSYVAASGVQFNNLNEIFLDAISREYAQDILEEVFTAWGVDLTQPSAVKFAEDLVWGFVIATTASNKADYHREFDIPHKSHSITVNFDTFSRVLAEGHGVTRRQFARGTADDMHRFLLEPENLHLLPRLADRVGCDPQMSTLAFDGSTHCTGLTSAQLSFTKLLERRNLFEDDSLLAEGASQRLMQGMSSGPRSIISR